MFYLETIKEVIILIIPLIISITTLIILIITLIIFGVSAYFAWKANKERKELFAMETGPYVAFSFDVFNDAVRMLIENTGKTAAKNIKIVSDPPISRLLRDPEQCKYLLSKGIKTLMPGEKIEIFLNTIERVFKSNKDIPMCYDICVSYEGGLLSKRREDSLEIDLRTYADAPYRRKRNIDNIVKELEEIKKELNGIKRILSPLEVKKFEKN